MKLIIDIPEEDFEWIQTHRSVTDYQITQMLYKRVMNGIPLDDVRAEIQDLYVGYRHGYEIMADVLRIIDNVGKSESQIPISFLNQSLEDAIDCS